MLGRPAMRRWGLPCTVSGHSACVFVKTSFPKLMEGTKVVKLLVELERSGDMERPSRRPCGNRGRPSGASWAATSASARKPMSIAFDSCHDSANRVAQSIAAARCKKTGPHRNADAVRTPRLLQALRLRPAQQAGIPMLRTGCARARLAMHCFQLHHPPAEPFGEVATVKHDGDEPYRIHAEAVPCPHAGACLLGSRTLGRDQSLIQGT